MGAMDALGPGAAGFMQGLQGAMQHMQQMSHMKAQEDYLKEQTKQLKAKQTLHDAMTAEMTKAAQAMVGTPGQPPQVLPQGTTLGGDTGPTPYDVQTQPSVPAQPPNMGPMLATMMKYQPDKVLPYILEKQTPKIDHIDFGDKVGIFHNGQLVGYQPKGVAPTAPKPQRPTVLGPNQVAVDETGAQIATGQPDPRKAEVQAALEAVGKMRATDPGPTGRDYNGMLDELAPYLDDARAAGLHARIMAEQQIEAKAKPEKPDLASIPDSVLRAVKLGVRGPIELKDGSLLDSSGAKKILDDQDKSKMLQQETRGASYGESKIGSFIDTKDPNKGLKTMTIADFNKANKEEPGRYLERGAGMAAMGPETMIEDMRGIANITKDTIKNLQTPFTAAQRLKLAYVLKDPNPNGAWENFFGSSVATQLTPDQQDYVVALRQLHEQSFTLRSLLKVGQGNEMVQRAILATLPGVLTPDKTMATKQLDAFVGTLDRVQRGIPKVKLRETGTPGETPQSVPVNPNRPKILSIVPVP